MKLFQRRVPTAPIELRVRAHNVNRAAMLIGDMYRSGTLAREDYELLSICVRAEIDAVARGLRAG